MLIRHQSLEIKDVKIPSLQIYHESHLFDFRMQIRNYFIERFSNKSFIHLIINYNQIAFYIATTRKLCINIAKNQNYFLLLLRIILIENVLKTMCVCNLKDTLYNFRQLQYLRLSLYLHIHCENVSFFSFSLYLSLLSEHIPINSC